jgi:hypothetical protein
MHTAAAYEYKLDTLSHDAVHEHVKNDDTGEYALYHACLPLPTFAMHNAELIIPADVVLGRTTEVKNAHSAVASRHPHPNYYSACLVHASLTRVCSPPRV